MAETPDVLSGGIDQRLADFFAASESRWTKLYSPDMQTSEAVKTHLARKIKARQPILEHIRRYTPEGGHVLESAAGTASLSLHLSKQGYQCSTLEQDPDMIALSQFIEEIDGGTIKRSQGSFLELPFPNDSFDTVFNHGVLEYFDEETIIRIIQEQLRVGKQFIFGVPTVWNKETYIEGDENLWHYWHWKDLIERSGAKILDSYSYFSYRKVRAWVNQVLGMKLQAISPGVGFVLGRP